MSLEMQRSYPHRQNWNGSYDSICIFCFRTIANRSTEADLVEDERGHVCAEWDLCRFKVKKRLLDAQVQ